MANTYTLLAKSTLTTTTATVTFSGIAQTYDTLVARVVARSDNASTLDYITVKLNNNTGSIYSGTVFYSNDGTSANGTLGFNTTFDQGNIVARANGATVVSNQFAVAEYVFPNYTSSTYNKAFSISAASENNITASFNGLWTNYFGSTSPITEITFGVYAGTGYVSGSTFYLYGLKNS